LNPVDGTTGISKTQISLSRCCNYLHTATRNAYINVHLNDGAGLSTIVAQGNIGSNVGGTEAKHTCNG
jgi:hypothetical protein